MHLTSPDGLTTSCHMVPEMASSQEEADTEIILHCLHVAASQSSSDITIRSPDTDVFILLLHFCNKVESRIYFDTGMGNSCRILDIKILTEIYGSEMCNALIALHAFSGCDMTSAFVRKGKIKPYNTLCKHQEFPAFNALGNTEVVSDETHAEIEWFVCCLYGKPNCSDVNKLQYDIARQKFQSGSSNVISSYDVMDLSLLPPCRATLKMHVLRVNYQVLIWKSAPEQHPNIKDPDSHGWALDESGTLEYDWCGDHFIPQELVEILSQKGPIEEEDFDDTDIQSGSLVDIIFETEVVSKELPH